MKNLRHRFERFCFVNQNKGIPNLMLYIALGNALVWLLSMFNGGTIVYQMLYFDKGLILQGQVWRLFTYVFTQSGSSYFALIFLYFFYLLGRHVEASMGTLRFNLFYFSGVIFMDVFAMIFCPVVPEGLITEAEYTYLMNTIPVYLDMAYYLHLSLILAFATAYPDSQFMILFIIPIKAWVMALIYLVLMLASVFNLSYPVLYFPHNLFPMVALGNYLLFAGENILNLFPLTWRIKLKRKSNSKTPKSGPIPFRPAERKAEPRDYTHRCTVCGRTDVNNPGLEFRYCSRCKGYHCYCIDHINDHTHVEE